MPEEIIIAILHKVGKGTRMANDLKLAAIFNEAAKRYPDFLGDFAWHPQYHDSKIIRDTLQALDLGGAIIRENASTKYFKISPRIAGAYGKAKYEQFNADQKAAIEELAHNIREAYPQ